LLLLYPFLVIFCDIRGAKPAKEYGHSFSQRKVILSTHCLSGIRRRCWRKPQASVIKKAYANKCRLRTSVRQFLFDKSLEESIIGPQELYGRT